MALLMIWHWTPYQLRMLLIITMLLLVKIVWKGSEVSDMLLSQTKECLILMQSYKKMTSQDFVPYPKMGHSVNVSLFIVKQTSTGSIWFHFTHYTHMQMHTHTPAKKTITQKILTGKLNFDLFELLFKNLPQ